MDSKSIPEDIVRTIVEQIPLYRSTGTLKALATVAKIFTYPCQQVLFQRIAINFRRKNLNEHVLNMHSFLTANPALRPYIRHLVITDNNIPSAHKRETSVPLVEIPTLELYSSYELRSSRDIYYGLLFGTHTLLPQLFDYLCNVSSISISIKNIQCSWLQFAPTIGESFNRLFQTPGLRKLYIQGLKFIPISALANFRDLRELYIKECDMDLFNCDVAYYNNPRATSTKFLGDSGIVKGRRRLEVLTIQDLPANSFQVLLNYWQTNTNDLHFVDMSSPMELTIYISTFRELAFVYNLLQMCENTIEMLTIHTWGLHLGTSFIPPSSPIGLGLFGHSIYDWFYHAMDPVQLTHPHKLLSLTLSISYWQNTSFAESNGELEWALEFLRELPANHNLKEIIINIRVGSEYRQDQLAFVDFQRYRGWKNWDIELNMSKWRNVETFLFVVYCDCGPRLKKGMDDIQSVMARQMPLLMESGKLSTGHVLLDNEGLVNPDIVQWIYDS